MNMKELYISPALRVLGFVPAEHLASGVELDDALGGSNDTGGVSNVIPDIGDVDVDIGI